MDRVGCSEGYYSMLALIFTTCPPCQALICTACPSCCTHRYCFVPTSTQGHPPPHQRFKNKKIPAHITYAYKEGVNIVKNDDFYPMPSSGSKQVDLLFVIANAPVSTVSLPNSGSESYVGLATAMELAMYELFKIYPAFFEEETKSSKDSERQ